MSKVLKKKVKKKSYEVVILVGEEVGHSLQFW